MSGIPLTVPVFVTFLAVATGEKPSLLSAATLLMVSLIVSATGKPSTGQTTVCPAARARGAVLCQSADLVPPSKIASCKWTGGLLPAQLEDNTTTAGGPSGLGRHSAGLRGYRLPQAGLPTGAPGASEIHVHTEFCILVKYRLSSTTMAPITSSFCCVQLPVEITGTQLCVAAALVASVMSGGG